FLRAVPASRWPSLPGFMFGRDIEGEDQDGKRFKLSDCRGQVRAALLLVGLLTDLTGRNAQSGRPLPDHASHLDEYILRALAGAFKAADAGVGGVGDVERHGFGEVVLDG